MAKQSPPPVPTDVTLSPEADDLRQKCLSIQPDERSSASEVCQHQYLVLNPDWSFRGLK